MLAPEQWPPEIASLFSLLRSAAAYHMFSHALGFSLETPRLSPFLFFSSLFGARSINSFPPSPFRSISGRSISSLVDTGRELLCAKKNNKNKVGTILGSGSANEEKRRFAQAACLALRGAGRARALLAEINWNLRLLVSQVGAAKHVRDRQRPERSRINAKPLRVSPSLFARQQTRC